MGPLSVSTHRGLVHWQGLLLAVSLSTFWCPPTNAQFAIVSKNVAEGKDAFLRFRNVPPDAQGFRWYRGEGARPSRLIAATLITPVKVFERGPEHRGRERMLADGSLVIKKVTMRDRGMYTVVAYLPNSIKEIGFGRLHVYRPVGEPTLLASNSTVTENKDSVVLTCGTNAASTEWLFNGMDLHLSERMTLSQNHRSLTIDPVQREDAGYYQCKVYNPISSAESWALELHVKNE